jgi:dGTPase
MDISDDIAYSTYDLEDSFKAGFVTPLDIIGASDEVKERLSRDIKKKIDEEYNELSSSQRAFGIDDFNTCALRIFDRVFELDSSTLARIEDGIQLEELTAILASRAFQTSSEIVENGYLRSELTSTLVESFLRGAEVIEDGATSHPQLRRARLTLEIFKEVEILKRFSYDALIMSPRLKVTEHRGKKIITEIFNTLDSDGGYLLMPIDWSSLYLNVRGKQQKRRVICDFIAGMTDRYCVEFYERITGSAPPSIHKPH